MGGRIESFLVPGLRKFLESYRDAPMAVASNGERENVALILDGSGLRGYFRIALDGHQVQNPKPHPEIYLRAAKGLGVPPSNCIVLEDSHSGVAAARAAGMRVIGLRTTHGYLPGTDLNVDNFMSGDLTEWLAAQTPPFKARLCVVARAGVGVRLPCAAQPVPLSSQESAAARVRIWPLYT